MVGSMGAAEPANLRELGNPASCPLATRAVAAHIQKTIE